MKRWLCSLSFICAISVHAQQTAPDLIRATGNQYNAVFAGDPQDYYLGLMLFAKRIEKENQETNHPFICWPQGVTLDQVVKIVEAYMQTNPQYLNYPMHDIVATSLMNAFPCH